MLLLNLALSLAAPCTPQTPQIARLRTGLPLVDAADVAVGDLNADGRLDVAFSGTPTALPALIRVADGDPLGLFESEARSLPGTDSIQVALIDMDGDSDPDLLTSNRWFQNQSGVLQDAGPHPQSLSIEIRGDVNNDGAGDVLEVGAPDLLYLNDGGGALIPSPAQLPPLASADACIGDLDGDGDEDIARVPSAGGAPQVLLNDGAGRFAPAPTQPGSNTTDPQQVLCEDVDADGDLDLIIRADSQLSLLRNDGNANFTPEILAIVFLPELAETGDFNGDGFVDLFAIDATTPSAPLSFLLFNRGDGTFSFPTGSGNLPPTRSAVGALSLDAEGDGDTDLLVREFDRVALWLNDGRGDFADATAGVQEAASFLGAISLGDLDGDGDLDAIGNASGLLTAYDNDGTGQFEKHAAVPPLTNARQSAIADLDGDGDLDAIVARSQLTLLRNQGGTLVEDAAALPSQPDSRGVRIADVSGDGSPDLLVFDGDPFVQPARLYLLINSGAGTFVDGSAQLPSVSPVLSGAEFGDLDGDSDLDLVLVGLFSSPQVLTNDGTGSFTAAIGGIPALPPNTATQDVGFFDLEGDGDLDLVLGTVGVGSAADPLRLYENDGTGSFTDVSSRVTSTSALGSRGFLRVDFDRDGNEDLIAHPGGVLWRNDGAAGLEQVTLLPGSSFSVGLVATGDVDLDGDLDFWADGSPGRILTNLERQLAWRAVPRVGKTLTLDLFGTAGESWALFSSPRTASLSTPFGLVRLDLDRLRRVATGVLDADGRASVTGAVPADPTLVGRELFWQALTRSPNFALTNLERTELTGL